MTILCSDEFDGTGSITGRSADYGISGVVWTDTVDTTALQLAGGSLSCISTVTGIIGRADYGLTGYIGQDYAPGTDQVFVTLSIITGNDVTPEEGRTLIGCSVHIGDVATHLTVYAAGGQWVMSVGFGGSPVIVEANTSYTVTLYVMNNYVEALGFGSYVSDYPSFLSSIGFQGLRIILGDVTKLASISAADAPPSVGSFYLNAPQGSVSAYSGASFIKIPPRPTLGGYGGATLQLVAPAGSMSAISLARAYFAGVGGLASLTSSSGAYAAVEAPGAKLASTARGNTSSDTLVVMAPAPALSSYAGANAAFRGPGQTLTSTATGTALARVELAAPIATVSSAGKVSETANAALSVPMATLIGYAGAVCSVALGGSPVLVSSGTVGGVSGIQVTVPMAQLSAAGTAKNYGSAILVAPTGRMAAGLQAYLIAPNATLTAIGTATITATYEAYALNLKHNDPGTVDEMTRYTNFPFTHVVRYKNSYYGVAAGGLYLLEGTTDAGAPIAWQFKTGITDFGTANLKTVTYAYFGGRLGPGATVSIYPGESGGNSYAYSTPRGQTAQNYRQQFGRGLKARYFAVGASGTDALELDSLELITDTLSRRI